MDEHSQMNDLPVHFVIISMNKYFLLVLMGAAILEKNVVSGKV